MAYLRQPALETAIRSNHSQGANAVVASSANELIIVDANGVTVTETTGDSTATDLLLTNAAGATAVAGVVSGYCG